MKLDDYLFLKNEKSVNYKPSIFTDFLNSDELVNFLKGSLYGDGSSDIDILTSIYDYDFKENLTYYNRIKMPLSSIEFEKIFSTDSFNYINGYCIKIRNPDLKLDNWDVHILNFENSNKNKYCNLRFFREKSL